MTPKKIYDDVVVGHPDDIETFTCDRCGKVMTNYFDVGYDGPKYPEEVAMSCHPYMTWEILCRGCSASRP